MAAERVRRWTLHFVQQVIGETVSSVTGPNVESVSPEPVLSVTDLQREIAAIETDAEALTSYPKLIVRQTLRRLAERLDLDEKGSTDGDD